MNHELEAVDLESAVLRVVPYDPMLRGQGRHATLSPDGAALLTIDRERHLRRVPLGEPLPPRRTSAVLTGPVAPLPVWLRWHPCASIGALNDDVRSLHGTTLVSLGPHALCVAWTPDGTGLLVVRGDEESVGEELRRAAAHWSFRSASRGMGILELWRVPGV